MSAPRCLWGWTSYSKSGWVLERGASEYILHLRGECEGNNETETLTIQVFTEHPVLLLRLACIQARTVGELLAFFEQYGIRPEHSDQEQGARSARIRTEAGS